MRKQITTTINRELLKEIKFDSIEYECNVNDVIEAAYLYIKQNNLKEEIEKIINEK